MTGIPIILLIVSKQINAIPFIWKAKALPQGPPVGFPLCLIGQNWVA